MFKFVSTKNINELFQRAILQNDIQRTRLILEEAMKDPRFNIDQINEEGLTALQYSCFAGNAEIVKVLATFGANWKIRDRDGYTLMHAAAMAGNGAVLRFLLQLGLTPVLKTDDGNLPIDVTDEISIIVILLRAMLDQGFLQEMQDYMMEHPKLKRNIFKELDKVKCREQEKIEILNEMPYTSHTLPRQKSTALVPAAALTPPKPPQVEKVKKSKGQRRSTSTFSELSDSIQQLDKLGLDPKLNTDLNNNDLVDSYLNHRASDTDTDTLKRDNSFSSSSSHSSKSSLRSGSGILRVGGGNRPDGNNNVSEADSAYRNTQNYLESRFPTIPARPKSVTFDFDADATTERHFSDCQPTNKYCDENGVPLLQPTSSSAQNNVINLNPVPDLDEPLYENASNARMRAKLTNVDSPGKVILQTSQKHVPPPLPPRAPTTQLTDSIKLNHITFNSNNKSIYDENYISDRQLGSETDSGIDVNETAGRMFALSVNDRRDDDTFSRPSNYHHADTYNTMSPYYSDTYRTLPRQLHSQSDLEPPINFGMRNRNNYADNSKYRSWNGRSFHENPNSNSNFNSNVEPYTSHNNNYRTINSTSDFYDTRYSKPSQSQSNSVRRVSPVSPIVEPDFSQYDFDNQPEIML